MLKSLAKDAINCIFCCANVKIYLKNKNNCKYLLLIRYVDISLLHKPKQSI